MIKYMNINEQRIIRAVSDALIAAGWKPCFVDDGGEDVPASTTDEVLEVIDSVEESKAWYEKAGKRCCFCVILFNGNDGKDVIYDFSVAPGFDGTVEIAHDLVVADIEAGR
jgi:hypothetical protein